MLRIRQRSSAHFPTSGKISVISSPLWPFFFVSNGDGRSLAFGSFFPPKLVGKGFPASRSKSGFGTNGTPGAGPTRTKRNIRRVAGGGQRGAFKQSGSRLGHTTRHSTRQA